MLTRLIALSTVIVFACGFASAADEPKTDVSQPQLIRLWDGDAPGAKGTADADTPTLTIYRAPNPKGAVAAFVVCPGGGYGGLAAHEGQPIAQWLNTLGITGAVLKYRLGPKYHHPVEMGDVSRAIRMMRANSEKWNIDAHRIGVVGFSAGGHLASTAATHFDLGDANNADAIERASSRPDLAILVYPVISMSDPYVHKGSRKNLLGDMPDEKLVELLSNEKQVTPQTPPCFLVHTADDATVPVQNSIEFTLACLKNKVPVELHLFEHGRHGFGIGASDPILGTWPAEAALWLAKHGFAQPAK
ncbi:MAG TPA: alpha/beta hydrolase [Humisphaera sp.]|jgi:acetyl esterase/lipase|nr:alpha/beta hydrolase [Humisphaera sp.]